MRIYVIFISFCMTAQADPENQNLCQNQVRQLLDRYKINLSDFEVIPAPTPLTESRAYFRKQMPLIKSYQDELKHILVLETESETKKVILSFKDCQIAETVEMKIRLGSKPIQNYFTDKEIAENKKPAFIYVFSHKMILSVKELNTFSKLVHELNTPAIFLFDGNESFDSVRIEDLSGSKILEPILLNQSQILKDRIQERHYPAVFYINENSEMRGPLFGVMPFKIWKNSILEMKHSK